MKKGTVWLMLIMAFLSCSLSACETTEGVGRDVEQLGEEIEEA